MLNGTMKQPEGFGASAFGSTSVPALGVDSDAPVNGNAGSPPASSGF